MPQVFQIESPELLDPIRLSWKSLWQRTPNASFFQSLEWLENYWHRCVGRENLRIYVVTSQGQTIGILPLAASCRGWLGGRVSLLGFPSSVPAKRFGPIGPNPAATWYCVMKHLRASDNWDVLHLSEGEQAHRAAQHAMVCAGVPFGSVVHRPAAVIDLTASGKICPHSGRCQLQHQLQAALETATTNEEIRFERYRPAGIAGDDDPRWDLISECADLEARSPSEHPFRPEPRRASYPFDDSHSAATRLGVVDLTTLRVRDRLIAFAYGYHGEGTVYSLKVTADPALGDLDPQSLLFAWLLKDGIDRGDRRVEMGSTHEPIHGEWMIRSEPTVQSRCYNTTIAAQMVAIVDRIRSKAQFFGPSPACLAGERDSWDDPSPACLAGESES